MQDDLERYTKVVEEFHLQMKPYDSSVGGEENALTDEEISPVVGLGRVIRKAALWTLAAKTVVERLRRS